ncbi:uncharacterized protein EI90DRAFT_3121904 [Cantharellus anzutake]|uniref:uncharacterized protein n=1 Tax=Cantharellus anzutake TaxID=1750568 RepID=UPI0019051B08|nr:uncharacterized protein EI90DRAFT_3121904 [Cantharellus anzutake]KAF8333570.1 hypothetical protein EI90DRAFT_3121904 [Cantharellus anzutake]
MSRPSSQSRQPSPLSARRLRNGSDVAELLGTDSSAIYAGRTAVITGAASGIGLAAAKKFAQHGLQVCLADIDLDRLLQAEAEVAEIIGKENTLAVPTDVSRLDQVEHLRDEVFKKFGQANVLMNNAAISKGRDGTIGASYENLGTWKDVLDVNLGGVSLHIPNLKDEIPHLSLSIQVINVIHTFTAPMIAQENPSLLGSDNPEAGLLTLGRNKASPILRKFEFYAPMPEYIEMNLDDDGIIRGNPAYNVVSKAAVKILSEHLAHDLRTRGARTTVHLFVPGWTWTGMTGASVVAEKPDGAWTAEETVNYMVRLGDFYIVCPDNETSPELDRLRILWAAQDVAEGRPPLSRWHPEWHPRFAEFVRDRLSQNQWED